MKNKIKDSYWMLAEVALPLASDDKLKNSFEAYFKHSLLFNSRLMLSDTQALNCTNLRRLILDNKGFEQFISPEFLTIALRKSADNELAPTLIDLRDEFYENNKHTGCKHAYLSNKELDYLQSKANLVNYEFQDLAQNFTKSTLSIFNSVRAKAIFGVDTNKVLLEQIRIEHEEKKILCRQFLHVDLEKRLEKLNKSDIWARHKSHIMKLADAPYVTGLPSVMEANPIYSPVHRECFELANNSPNPNRMVKTGFSLDLSLFSDYSTYEYALSLLTAEDILNLRSSHEYQIYQKHISNGVANENEQQKAMYALKNYQDEINEYILTKILGKKIGKQSFFRKNISAIKNSNDSANFILGLVLDASHAGIYSIMNIFAMKKLDTHGRLSPNEQMQAEVLLKNKLNSNNEQIDAQINTSFKNNEIIYSSASIE